MTQTCSSPWRRYLKMLPLRVAALTWLLLMSPAASRAEVYVGKASSVVMGG